MKSLKIFSTTVLVLLFAQLSFAQKTSTESINVSGNCGMCKKKIEKAAKDAGATSAVWSTQTKVLTVRYNSLSTNSAKIQQKIADVGYDTPQYKATDEAYSKLDPCCQYDRSEGVSQAGDKEKSCCDKGTATNGKADCCKKDATGKTNSSCCSDSKSTTTKKSN